MSSAAAASPWLRARSRADRCLAAVALALTSPLVGVLAWRIRSHDGGPPFIQVTRTGRGGATFGMWKLRMRAENADGTAIGIRLTGEADDRITPIGHRLRAFHLDEIPQLANVVRGEMLLLGPRPEDPAYVDLDDPAWRAVLGVAPGMAGPTQVVVNDWEREIISRDHGEDSYRAVVLPVKLAIDRWYVEGASPWTDLVVGWSMVQRFVLGRDETAVERVVRARVPESAVIARP